MVVKLIENNLKMLHTKKCYNCHSKFTYQYEDIKPRVPMQINPQVGCPACGALNVAVIGGDKGEDSGTDLSKG